MLTAASEMASTDAISRFGALRGESQGEQRAIALVELADEPHEDSQSLARHDHRLRIGRRPHHLASSSSEIVTAARRPSTRQWSMSTLWAMRSIQSRASGPAG